MLMAEKFIAGMTGDKDEMAKAMAMLKGHITYLPQALRNMTHALLHEKSLTENTSKLDMAGRTVTRQGFGLRNRAEGGGLGESAAALAIDGLGITYRMLGYRPMIAIDEFFGAGDEEFRKKTDIRLKNMIKSSKVVLFASHDFELVKSICNRVISFDEGKIIEDKYI